MIERLLAAEDALGSGEIDLAERLFAQVAEADARNAIAIVGLARIAERRGDRDGARTWLRRALELDPDEAAARRLLRELDASIPPAPAAAPAQAPAAVPAPVTAPATVADPAPVDKPPEAPVEAPMAKVAPRRTRRPTVLDRIRRWLGRGARR